MKNFLNKAEIKLDLSEKPKSVLSPEVEEAMAELRKEIEADWNIEYKAIKLTTLQNLLNALDKQFYDKLGEEK